MADSAPFLNFLSKDPDQLDFLKRGIDRYQTGSAPFSSFGNTNYATLSRNLSSFGQTGQQLAFATLNDILNNQGRSDRTAVNRDLRAVGRDTEAQQLALTGDAASRGMQNSGVVDAIKAAIGASGADREAAVRSNETELAEKRKREDLMIALEMILKPSIDLGALASGSYNASKNRESQEKSALLGALSGLFG